MNKKTLIGIIVATLAIVATVIIIYFFIMKKSSTTSTTTTTTTSSSQSSTTPTPSSSPIIVQSFVVPNNCSAFGVPYFWATITFTSNISGALTQINTVTSDGTVISWYNELQGIGLQLSAGNQYTVWLGECPPCQYLNMPITQLQFIVNSETYTVNVTPVPGQTSSPFTISLYYDLVFIPQKCM
ncbi:MAG: hypothetical protein OWQ50_00165 [Acidianus infernus]|nr:hypothetical protein [Acidianus infernus]